MPPSMGGTCPSPLPSDSSSDQTRISAEVLMLSASRKWSPLTLSSAETIREGEDNWKHFVERATPERLTKVKEALEAMS